MTGIVVGHDGSTAADDALDWALAHVAGRPMPVTVVRAWDLSIVAAWSPVPPSQEDIARVADAETTEAERAAERARARAPGVPVEVRVVQGRPVTVLPEAAQDASLLVLGRRGAGRTRLGLGSAASGVLRAAECPVALVPDGWHEPAPAERGADSRVVVGCDGSPAALCALRWATAEADRIGAELEIVFAWQISTLHGELAADDVASVPPLSDYQALADRRISDAVRRVREQCPQLRVGGRAVRGQAAKVMLDAADGADLLVLGSRGIGGFRGLLLGSTSDQVSRHATCPTVVVRAGQERLDDDEPGDVEPDAVPGGV